MSFSRPSPEEVEDWLRGEIKDGSRIHGIAETGESDHLWFWLGCWTKPHRDSEDLQLLSTRYFQMPKPSAPIDMEPTFKPNGLNLREDRESAGLPDSPRKKLARLLLRANNDTKDEGDETPLYL